MERGHRYSFALRRDRFLGGSAGDDSASPRLVGLGLELDFAGAAAAGAGYLEHARLPQNQLAEIPAGQRLALLWPSARPGRDRRGPRASHRRCGARTPADGRRRPAAGVGQPHPLLAGANRGAGPGARSSSPPLAQPAHEPTGAGQN
ncbi:hypothetical protein C8255_25945 [filamentous cyanobacterium CCP3]|nr:hypothetical protein C8255_25945 [filamentous cyanobacterium CCP3]